VTVRRLGSLSRVTDGADAHHARKRLEAEQGRVEGLIRSVRGGFGDGSENDETSELAHYDQHPADMGSETFEREKDLSILEQLETELAEIQAALRRIDEGTYGVDEVTGNPIPPERLEAVPTARTNVGDSRPNDSRPNDRHRNDSRRNDSRLDHDRRGQ
jgi:RNA polymerase-binding transcription factor DksA